MTESGQSRLPVLEARGVTKTYPGTAALKGVDFRVEAGRIHALIGENGAGKSTLVKILAGVEQPSSGHLWLDGEAIELRSARDAARRGIAMIHQELQLFHDLTIAENLFVGRELVSRWGLVDVDAQQRAAGDVLHKLGQPLDPTTRVGSLPLGLQQIVEIARALVQDVRVLMMDEPTSALTTSEIEHLFRVMRDLASRGVSIVYISHRLEELLAIADSVTVLRDGRGVGEARAAEIDVPWIVERMTGRPLEARPDGGQASRGDTRLSVRDLTLAPRPGRSALSGVSFDLCAGEVLGIYGLMGAGRTELFESLLGVHEDASGEVVLDGRRLDTLDVTARVRAGLVLVPEDRQRAGLFPSMSVLHNMTMSSLHLLSAHGWLAAGREQVVAERLTATLQIKAPALRMPVSVLSGGNQQKVVIARGAMLRPKVLLLDEPTRGVDVAAKAEILACMRQLAEDGMAVVFASSDLHEIFAVASRVLVMARGRIVAEHQAGEATEHALASAASAMTDQLIGEVDARA